MNITSRASWHARAPHAGVQEVAIARRTEFMVHHSGAAAGQAVADIQAWCMDGRGFLDIDYNFLIRGTTGQIYEGRGWNAVGSHCVGHNTAAIGVCIIGVDDFTPDAQASLRWLYTEAVRRAGHDLKVLGHRDAAVTECPGTLIENWLKAGAIHTRKPPRDLRLTSPQMTGVDVTEVQHKVGAPQDGIYGPVTESLVRHWQAAHHLTADGIVGPKTRAAMGL